MSYIPDTQKLNKMKSNLLYLALIGLIVASCNNKTTADVPTTQIDTTNHTGSKDSTGMSTNSGQPVDTAKMMSADSTFLSFAYQAGKFEIQAAKLAKTKSQNAQVKEFADMMITDHTAMGKDVESMAAQKNVTLPGDIGADLQKEYDKLKGLSGSQFDKEYADANVKGHEEVISKFEKASKNSDDSPEVQQLASAALPKLKTHKEHADMLKGGLK
jgi:putative membrane protein